MGFQSIQKSYLPDLDIGESIRFTADLIKYRRESTDRNGGMSDTAIDNPYLRDAVLTATQEQLQLMLYDGAIKFAMQGRDALVEKNFERSCDRLTRAQNIILEMHAGLNHEINPELCSRMAALYMFMYRKLIDANVTHDLQALDDAVKILQMERETWQMVVDKVAAERASTVPQNDALTSAAQADPQTVTTDEAPLSEGSLSING